MPELPEVETTRRGVAPHIVGRRIAAELDAAMVPAASEAPMPEAPLPDTSAPEAPMPDAPLADISQGIERLCQAITAMCGAGRTAGALS